MLSETAPSRLKLIVAFAAIYVVWGSTYLAILFAIETLPPFLMAGVRFLIAGGLLYAWARCTAPRARRASSGSRRASPVRCSSSAATASSCGRRPRVASGVTALLVGIVPCWMVLIDWLRPRGVRPGAQVVLGLALGLVGLISLIGPDALLGGGRADFLGVGAVLLASFSWAAGSIYSRHATMPPAPFLSTAMQMLVGGVALSLLGLGLGEPWRIDAAAFSLRSILALLYLIVFGSIVASRHTCGSCA